MRIISDVRASVSSGVYMSHFGHRRRPCRALSVLSSCAAVPSVRRRQGHSALSGLARGAPGPGCRPRAYGVSAPARPPQVLGSDDDDDVNAKASSSWWPPMAGNGPIHPSSSRRPIDRRRKQISRSIHHPVHALGGRPHTHFPVTKFVGT